MKITLALALLLTAVTLTGCYEKHLVLQAEVVSMTKAEGAPAAAMKKGPEINESWCQSEEPVWKNTRDDDKKIGMADQVIYKAQKSKNADYITDVRIWRDSEGCALLTGRPATL